MKKRIPIELLIVLSAVGFCIPTAQMMEVPDDSGGVAGSASTVSIRRGGTVATREGRTITLPYYCRDLTREERRNVQVVETGAYTVLSDDKPTYGALCPGLNPCCAILVRNQRVGKTVVFHYEILCSLESMITIVTSALELVPGDTLIGEIYGVYTCDAWDKKDILTSNAGSLAFVSAREMCGNRTHQAHVTWIATQLAESLTKDGVTCAIEAHSHTPTDDSLSIPRLGTGIATLYVTPKLDIVHVCPMQQSLAVRTMTPALQFSQTTLSPYIRETGIDKAVYTNNTRFLNGAAILFAQRCRSAAPRGAGMPHFNSVPFVAISEEFRMAGKNLLIEERVRVGASGAAAAASCTDAGGKTDDVGEVSGFEAAAATTEALRKKGGIESAFRKGFLQKPRTRGVGQAVEADSKTDESVSSDPARYDATTERIEPARNFIFVNDRAARVVWPYRYKVLTPHEKSMMKTVYQSSYVVLKDTEPNVGAHVGPLNPCVMVAVRNPRTRTTLVFHSQYANKIASLVTIAKGELGLLRGDTLVGEIYGVTYEDTWDQDRILNGRVVLSSYKEGCGGLSYQEFVLRMFNEIKIFCKSEGVSCRMTPKILKATSSSAASQRYGLGFMHVYVTPLLDIAHVCSGLQEFAVIAEHPERPGTPIIKRLSAQCPLPQSNIDDEQAAEQLFFSNAGASKAAAVENHILIEAVSDIYNTYNTLPFVEVHESWHPERAVALGKAWRLHNAN